MSANNFADKSRLTEQEKKDNHIASEQKRRAAIREGFDTLCVIVPGMRGQARSEAVVLQASVEFLREQLKLKEGLRSRATGGHGMSLGDFDHVYTEEQNRIVDEHEARAAQQDAAA